MIDIMSIMIAQLYTITKNLYVDGKYLTESDRERERESERARESECRLQRERKRKKERECSLLLAALV